MQLQFYYDTKLSVKINSTNHNDAMKTWYFCKQHETVKLIVVSCLLN